MALTLPMMTAVAGSIFTAAQFNTYLRDNINALGASAVLQVQQAQYGTQTLSSSSTYADTGLTCNITPVSTSSKVLALVNINGIQKEASDTRCQLKLVRGASDLFVFEQRGGFTNNTDTVAVGGAGFAYRDSPASVSAQTYKVQFASQANSSGVYVQVGGSYSSLVLLELAG